MSEQSPATSAEQLKQAETSVLIRLDNVQKWYGARQALTIDKFLINSGDNVLLIGANGSGKSTLLRLLAGITLPTSGTVNRAALARITIAYVPQGGGLYGDMTLRENLTIIPRIYSMRRASAGDWVGFVEQTGLDAFLDVPVGELSGGFRQLAAFACALASAPDALLLDEPLSELDQEHAEQICEALERICLKLKFLVISSHDPPELTFLNRRVVVSNGRIA